MNIAFDRAAYAVPFSTLIMADTLYAPICGLFKDAARSST